MYIVLEKNNFLEVLKYSDSDIKKFYCSSSLDNFLSDYNKENGKKIILSDEKNFNFFSYRLNNYFENDFSINDLKEILKEKEKEIKFHYSDVGTFINYNIDDIFVNGKDEKYVLGKKGDINFDINLFFLNPEKELLFKKIKGNNFHEELDIYPASFFTFDFLRNSFKKENIYLLYIFEDEVKLLEFKNGFYNTVSKNPMGISSLKEIFREKDIMNFYFKSFNEKNVNSFAEDLIRESIDFYSNLLTNWLNENVRQGENLFLVSELVKNKYFLEILGEHFSKKVQGFVTPFNKVSSFKKFGLNWSYSDIDILSYLNSA